MSDVRALFLPAALLVTMRLGAEAYAVTGPGRPNGTAPLFSFNPS
jgi:hypothetical protein